MLRIERREWPGHERAVKLADFAASATPGIAESSVPVPATFPLRSTITITLACDRSPPPWGERSGI